MKILVYSPSFHPNIGGLETIISTLASEFMHQGHEVKLVCQTPATEARQFPFEVIRNPSKREILRLTYWCEVYFQGCVSLKGLWSLLLVHRCLVITHQTWYCRNDGSIGWQDYLKKFASRFAVNISVSHSVAKALSSPSTVIPNSYREDIFYEIPEIRRDQELVFLGRLVSDKGVSLLLSALTQLKRMGLTPNLTIIGSGEAESQLRQQVIDYSLHRQVTFAGVKIDHELARFLNSHQIMVIPSLWDEPFGIVALEGIACGCVVVGSERGGLKDAIGSCGITFPNGDVQALTQILLNLLQHPEQLSIYRANSLEHLLRHQKSAIAKAYLEVMEIAIKSGK